MAHRDRLLHLVVTAPAAVSATELYRFYRSGDDEVQALRGVSVSVDAGEIVAIVGPSGAGKSTLLACLTGLDEPDGGIVRIAGKRMSARPEVERTRIRARRIGLMLQHGNLVAHLTVRQNVLLAQRISRSAAAPPARVLEEVGAADLAGRLPTELSGGQAARAALAVALASGPDVLVADEPTGELDHHAEADLLALLAVRAASGGAVLVVTHSDRVTAAATRVVRLRDGRILPA